MPPTKIETTVLVVHGWDDDPTAGWLGWLTNELASAGYTVLIPHLQTKPKPNLKAWMQQLYQASDELPDGSMVIGHSLGCWLAIRMIEALPVTRQLKAFIAVSGFMDAPTPRAQTYFQPEPAWNHVRQIIEQSICIYSDNDRIVTPARSRALAHRLHAKLICLPGRGHFLGSRGMDEFPELLELVRAL